MRGFDRGPADPEARTFWNRNARVVFASNARTCTGRTPVPRRARGRRSRSDRPRTAATGDESDEDTSSEADGRRTPTGDGRRRPQSAGPPPPDGRHSDGAGSGRRRVVGHRTRPPRPARAHQSAPAGVRQRRGTRPVAGNGCARHRRKPGSPLDPGDGRQRRSVTRGRPTSASNAAAGRAVEMGGGSSWTEPSRRETAANDTLRTSHTRP